jgi:hypothetical protein
MIDDNVVLQNCMNSQKVEHDSCSETCVASSNDGNWVTSMEAEQVSYTKGGGSSTNNIFRNMGGI